LGEGLGEGVMQDTAVSFPPLPAPPPSGGKEIERNKAS
jgi:hypothetical protein